MRMKRNLDKYFMFVVAFIPLLLPILQVFRLGTFDLQALKSDIFSVVDTPMFNSFYTWITNNFLGGVSNIYLDLVFAYLTFFVYYYLFCLLFEFILFIPKVARKFIDGFYS